MLNNRPPTNPTTLNVGLGLRREILNDLRDHPAPALDFLEIAPENWMRVGGHRKNTLDYFSQRYPIVCHGLSLSLGSPAPLDENFIKELKLFLDNYNTAIYSEHLSFCSDTKGMLYDLFPLPFTEEAVHYVSTRIKKAQDILERRIAIENISYYSTLSQDLSELEFIQAILHESDCDLLLDINNLYVNSINHQYNPEDFLNALNKNKIAYIHIAGHDKSDNIILDTHGEAISEPVWRLLQKAYQIIGIKPTLLERDNDLPPLSELLHEINHIKLLQEACIS